MEKTIENRFTENYKGINIVICYEKGGNNCIIYFEASEPISLLPQLFTIRNSLPHAIVLAREMIDKIFPTISFIDDNVYVDICLEKDGTWIASLKDEKTESEFSFSTFAEAVTLITKICKSKEKETIC